jgi:carboxypeptidase PM20D1
VKQPGGHSSVAPPRTAIGILGRALDRIDRAPFPSQIGSLSRETLQTLGPHLPLPHAVAFANLDLFDIPVRYTLGASPELNAMIRTTAATTIVTGGNTANVLPELAEATINFRVLPDDSSLQPPRRALPSGPRREETAEERKARDVELIERLRSHVEAVVDDDRVTVRVDPDNKFAPSQESSTRANAYDALGQAVTDVFAAENVIVVPFLVTAGTDARFYEAISRNVYRFLPVVLEPSDLSRIHGVNERVRTGDYKKAVVFYRQLIRKLGATFPRAKS